jgi:anti-sigma B factor antagonist
METGVSTSQLGDAVIVTVAGDIDVTSAPDLTAALQPHLDHAPILIIDLQQANFIDSTGLSVFVAAAQTRGRTTLRLVITTERIARIFSITGLDQVFGVFDSREGAMEA